MNWASRDGSLPSKHEQSESTSCGNSIHFLKSRRCRLSSAWQCEICHLNALMSFFGFEEKTLARGKDRRAGQDEDLAVYTWGEENYDGLGDVLQEDHDDLNDETFGEAGAVGKDFDFSNPALPDRNDFARLANMRVEDRPSQSSTPLTLESIWDDKSPFSMRLNGSNRNTSSSLLPRGESPAASIQHRSQSGIRTLQEIEAEMRASVEQTRQEAILQQRQQQYYLEQQRILQQKQREEEELLLRHEEEREYQRQRLLYQQEQAQQQIQLQRLQQQQLLQQREQHQHHRTPPPRMLPVSQSPRFMEHQQRQIIFLQQQQEQQQLLRLQQLQDQLRVEELERQLRSQHISSVPPDRQPSGPTLADMEALQHQQQLRQRSQSPAARSGPHRPAPLEDTLPYLPQSIQLQQKLLSEMAQAELLREMQGLSQVDQEALRVEAMRKILEAEKMEEKRRRKAAKIAHMSRYNDLMTQSDKDFITRIQVSQLVSQDPYADDFYAQVYGAIVRSRMGLSAEDERVLKFGASGGVALGAPTKGGNRRPNAMQRMQQQVERIVSNARKREEEKGIHSLHSLQGALGKTSGRSYKAAPRQLLQVDSSSAPSSSPTLSHAQPHAHISKADSISKSPSDAAANAARMGRETLSNGNNGEELVRMEPLTQREILVTLENMYDLVLSVEQLRRDQPHPDEGEEVSEQWSKDFDDLVNKMWTLLKVMLPLATSTPHPFISLLSAAKGKKILPRVTRHFDQQRMNTLLTLLIACFSQLDVISHAALLDTLEDTPERADVERQTQAFLSSVLQSILPIIVKGSLRLVCGLVGLLMHGQDIIAIAKSRPGLALLTLFLTRVEVIKQGEVDEIPTQEDFAQWQLMFDHLFQLLTPEFPLLFPSTRMAVHLPRDQPHINIPGIDSLDQPVWQFLAALALQASSTQHQVLVSSLREKVLDNVLSAKKGWVVDEEERTTKLANVDLFLHALGLDSSQITM